MWQEIFITVLQKIPWENLLVRRRSETERLEQLATLMHSAPKAEVRSPTAPQETAKTEPQGLPGASERPTTAETKEALRRRLAKELYRVEMDLQAGARIAGKPCNCLDAKHNLGIEATAEELMSYGHDPIYQEVIDWGKAHQAEFEPEEIAKRAPEYYQHLAPEVRDFRVRLMGSPRLSAMLSLQQKEQVKERVLSAVNEKLG